MENFQCGIGQLSDHIIEKVEKNHKDQNMRSEDEEIVQSSEDEDSDFDAEEEDDSSSGLENKMTKKLKSKQAAQDSIYESEETSSANESSQKDSSKKKGRNPTCKSKLPKKSTDILKNWFLQHIQNPYPCHEAKETLSRMTGLSRKQIQNWFTNTRKRFLEPLKKRMEKEGLPLPQNQII